MPGVLSGKRIIMIHGLASKPPQDVCDELWRKCVIENIRVDNPAMADQMEADTDLFKSAYWANATPHHLEDDQQYVAGLRVQVDKVIADRKRLKNNFHVGTKDKLKDFFVDKALDVVNLCTNALKIQDDVMRKVLREVDLYEDDQYIADRMRRPLEVALRQAWKDGREVAILSHSMGTFIAYDVLWRFSHRSTSPFDEYNPSNGNNRVALFVTMGSPLANKSVRSLLFAKYHTEKGQREFPTNIDHWHNYACLGDIVSHDHDFSEPYFDPMIACNAIASDPEDRTRDYVKLFNPFEVVAHDGNEESEKRNPHKSYGYLVQPKLSQRLQEFLKG
ncbi:MAG: hypothetical protein V3T31_03790 [candidate division Zixibacteria bacterium]